MKKYLLLLVLLFVLCLCAGSFAIYKIYCESSEVAEAEGLSTEFEIYSPVVDNAQSYEDIYNDFVPKLQLMRKINADVTGWLYIPSTNISYPLMLCDDNEYYLTHSASKKYSAAGSLFVDKRGFNSGNTIIYGHNMGRASNVMFHDITNFADRSYFESVKDGYLINEEGITRLGIFAYSLTKPQTEFYNDYVSLEFISENALNYREPQEGGLFTLSTCAYDYKNARAVLNCTGNLVYSAN